MAKHTPGPWRAETFAIYAGRESIGHVGGTLGAGPRVQEQIANARLIAAAPDLLVVCEGIIGINLDDPDTEKLADEFETLAQCAISAIRKAEGG